jgi:hypothetical protein
MLTSNAVGALERGLENIGLEDVASDVEDPDARIAQRVGEILGASPHEVVVDDQPGDIFREQPIRCVRPDQSGAADEYELLTFQFH